MGLAVAGPQVHLVMTLPPSVAALNAVASMYGTIEIELVLEVILPPKVVSSPTAVITPFTLVSTDFMNLVRVLVVALDPEPLPEPAVQELVSRLPMFASGDVEMDSETEVRHADAARITSDTRARTV